MHLFRANVTVPGLETSWFFMFWANFNNFNLTAPFLAGVLISYFFCYAFPIFRANFTKQWTLSNQLQFFPAVCVCVWDIWECFKMTAPVPSHTQLFHSKAALLSIQQQLWGLIGCTCGTFDKSQFFAIANYLAQTRKTKQIALQKFWLALDL